MSEQNKYGTAFKGLVSTDWAITKDGYRQMLAIAARIPTAPTERGVAVADGERLQYTRNVTERDGVAIIPIIGPIFRYANFFTYYCGGVTVQDLAKDLQAAIDNPNIYSILFEVNSPGGEVGGINELGKMIFAARKMIPMTAYVDVYNCSAAYWLSSACGDIVTDETAQIGSIGVCTAYLDDRKNLEMNGLEEIEIISSQSPYKNMPPTTDEGKQRIQNRIDGLAQIFVDTVAKHRGVPVKKVLKDFGQGDVLIGQDAVDAGMADRTGDFETTLAELSNAHTPELIRMNGGSRATLNPATGVAFLTDTETVTVEEEIPAAATEQISNEVLNSEENMSEENKPAVTTAPTTQTTQTQAPAAVAPTVDTAEFEKMKADLAASKKREAELAAEVTAKTTAAEAAQAETAKTKLRAELTETAKDFAGDKAAKVSLMETMSEKFGADSKEMKDYVADQNALASQIAEGELFKEQGANAAPDENSAISQIERMTAARASEKGITKEQAMTEVAAENPELYNRYNKETYGR